MADGDRLLRVDADVHCAVPSVGALFPYLTDHWRHYLQENGFQQPQAVEYSYPSWSRLVATQSPRTTLDEIRQNVLGASDIAILSCFFGVESVLNPYLSAALATAVNAWIRTEYLEQDHRLFASAVVPIVDTEAAVKEVQRIGVDRRFVQLSLPARSWQLYGNRQFWPVWDAAVEADLAVGIHYGGLSGTPGTPVGPLASHFEDYCAATQLFASHLNSLITEGVFDQFPTLRITMMESGVTWLPALYWKLDTDWKANRREVPWVRRPPSDYIRKHVRFGLQPFDGALQDGGFSEMLDWLGSDEMVMFSTDYPHPHASKDETFMAFLTRSQTKRLLHENAWHVFDLASRVPSGQSI